MSKQAKKRSDPKTKDERPADHEGKDLEHFQRMNFKVSNIDMDQSSANSCLTRRFKVNMRAVSQSFKNKMSQRF